MLPRSVIGGGPLDAGAHAVVVVLQHEEAGVQAVLAPEPGEVGALMERAVVDRAIAEIELDDAVGALVAQGIGHADAERNMPADDAVAAHQKSFLTSKRCIEPPLPLTRPVPLP